MAVRAPSQVRIETLVARGRLTLAFFALLAIFLRLPGLPGTPALTTFTLGFLAYACLLAGLLRTRFGASPHLPGATHALDLTAYAAYVWLLGGPALPVLAWFLKDLNPPCGACGAETFQCECPTYEAHEEADEALAAAAE